MMDVIFIVLWPILFFGMAGLAWRFRVNQGRIYILILVNMTGLASLFYLFPFVLELSGR